MSLFGFGQIAIFLAIVALVLWPLGRYMARLFTGERVLLSPILAPLERLIYRACGIDARDEQHWTAYALAVLLFNLVGVLFLYALLRLQGSLPLNPQGFAGLEPALAFNTAVSFVTNTNWQAYGGETTMSHLSQMLGLTVQNFLSAGTGIALAIALTRAFVRSGAKTIGSFWVDLTRSVLYLLLPGSIVIAFVLVWQGVPQTLVGSVDATTLEGAKQTIALGPVASQMAIKHLGTNGGGFFNANAAHPFENPTAFTNLIHMVSIAAIGAALTASFGRMVGNRRQGFALLGAMGILLVLGIIALYWAEASGNAHFAGLGINQDGGSWQPGGNMEGKEVRFGPALSAIFAALTTATSCGAVNAMHDSLTPLGGLVPLINMQLGEIILGGVGSGLYGMILFAIVTVFVAGLMVGRTPEYLGKKIEAREVQMAVLAIFILPFVILVPAAIASVSPDALSSLANAGPHGFSEILYAFSSASANNGSAFAGLAANTTFYNLATGFAMLIGRFGYIVPMLAIAGSIVAKRSVPSSAGTFPTDNGLFVALLVAVIVIVGGLTFFPALALGPVVEHLLMLQGASF